MTINVVQQIDEWVKVRHVLISVSDKRGLETLVPKLLEINPGVRFFSTGGTYGRLNEILGSAARECLTQVSEYTGQPETQGGLVKTLDYKIYLGLLTETYNDAHKADLARTNSVPIDMVVVNLYPFRETIAKARCQCRKRPRQHRHRRAVYDSCVRQKFHPRGQCGGPRRLPAHRGRTGRQ